jgi:isoleucyl-tRNA synthetase
MSPIAPFYAEQLFLDLNRVSKREEVVSVHLSHFPEADTQAIDQNLEEKMTLAQNISSLVHSLRKKHTIKVRQPLSRVLIPVLQPKVKAQIQDVEDLILSEVNIKKVEYIDDTSGVLVKKIKPNFKKLGKEYGPQMKEIAAIIQGFGQEQIKQLERDKTFPVSLNGQAVNLTLEDVEITSEDIPGWIVASENGLTVALDITITEDLKKEGISRDVVNRVQNLRKDMGLEVQDKIKIDVQVSSDLVNAALESNKEYICAETQALELNLQDKVEGASALDMDDFVLNLKITVVN